MIRLVSVLLCTGFLAACATGGGGGDELAVSPGSTVHFDSPPVAGANGSVFFQNGRKVDYGQLDRRNRAYCELGTRAEAGAALPRHWTVTRFRLQKMRTGRTRVFSMSFPDGEIDIVDFRNFMWLESDAGDEGWLVCSREEEAWRYAYIPVRRFADIIGPGFELVDPFGKPVSGGAR